MSEIRPRAARIAGLAATAVAAGVFTAAPANAVVGDDAKEGTYAYTAQLTVGDFARGCSGVLVDPQWVLTDSNCFVDKPGAPVAAGKPRLKATVTVGRTDLGTSKGTVSAVSELVPHPSRGVVLARLEQPATGVAPLPVADSTVQTGDTVRAAGYGRTKDEWVPQRLHTAAFTTKKVDDGAVTLSAKSEAGGICKGDAGGPIVRERGGRAELVALSGASNGAGCFGSEVTGPAQATATRTDGLGSWVNRARLTDRAGQLTETVAGGADFNGDGRDDVVVRFKDGTLHVLYGGADGKLEYGRALWHDDSWKRAKQIAAGDFNGDGKGDIAAVWQDGTLRLYLGDNRGELAEDYKKMWPDDSVANMRIARYKVDDSGRDGLLMAWGSGYLHAYPTNADGTLSGKHWAMWNNDSWKTIPQFTTGDFNGDGKDDVVAIWGNGEFRWYPGNGNGTLDASRAMWHDTSWGTSLKITGGDVDGDGKSDVIRVSGGGEFQFYKGDGKGKLDFGSPMVPTLG